MSDASLNIDAATQRVTVDDDDPTVSVIWDRAIQDAVTEDSSGPTIASRAYAVLHTATYDAWASYVDPAVGTAVGNSLQQPASENTDANKAEAMSFAAYRVLVELFPDQSAIAEQTLIDLGFDPALADADSPGPAGIGIQAAEAVLTARRIDGANQLDDYANTVNYAPINPHPLQINDITRWTPENVPIDPEDTSPEQTFLTPQWSVVEPFGLESSDAIRPPAPQPFFTPGVEADLDFDARTITFADGTQVPVSSDLIGPVINPEFVQQAEQVVSISANLTDTQKLIAEFWEDASGTSFPPGTFMTFGQFVSARDNHTLDQDAQLFLPLANAVMDAGIATWEAKVFFDYVRPVRAIRDLGELELIGEPGTDEVTGETGHTIEAWAGPGLGTQTILAENFLTYQTPDADPSPPFAEYTSGHSAFSSAGAEVLRLITGSDAFGGSVTFNPGESRFEPTTTPSESITLLWDTFSAAAAEAGLSRLYGGIHFEEGDLNGRTLGTEAGRSAWTEAQNFISGATPGDDVIYGNATTDTLVGGEGSDQVYGNQGDDLVSGAADADWVFGGKNSDQVYGNQGDDQLYGGRDDDDLFGGAGNDLIYGNAGDDRIYGNKGDDTLVGGDGEDEFAFLNGTGQDTVADFGDGDTIAVQTDIDGSGIASFDDLEIAANADGDAVVDLGDGSVTLQGVSPGDLAASDFSFF